MMTMMAITFAVSQVLDTYTGRWERMNCTGECPGRRFGHSCVYYNGMVIIFGGSSSHFLYRDNNILFCLDVKNWKWSKKQCTGTPPQERSSHSMTVVDNKAYVFGGFNRTDVIGDIVVLDLNTLEWTFPLVEGQRPRARAVHRVVAMGDNLLLFGGRTLHGEKLNDLHWFCTKTLQWWQDPKIIGTPPAARGGCTMVAIKNKVLVFFGRDQNESCLFDGVHMLVTFPQQPGRAPEWRTPTVIHEAGSVNGPSARSAHGFVVAEGKVVVFGGYMGRTRTLNDLWFLRFGPSIECEKIKPE